jgi:hypothetical protein
MPYNRGCIDTSLDTSYANLLLFVSVDEVLKNATFLREIFNINDLRKNNYTKLH